MAQEIIKGKGEYGTEKKQIQTSTKIQWHRKLKRGLRVGTEIQKYKMARVGTENTKEVWHRNTRGGRGPIAHSSREVPSRERAVWVTRERMVLNAKGGGGGWGSITWVREHGTKNAKIKGVGAYKTKKGGGGAG